MNKIMSYSFLYLAPKKIQLLTCITLKRFKKNVHSNNRICERFYTSKETCWNTSHVRTLRASKAPHLKKTFSAMLVILISLSVLKVFQTYHSTGYSADYYQDFCTHQPKKEKRKKKKRNSIAEIPRIMNVISLILE